MNESKISAIVGGLIILVIGVMVFNYFRNLRPGTTTPDSVSTETTQTPQPENNSYTVVAGDSLWAVAQKELGNGFRWTEIRDLNNLSNADDLETGQQLLLPSDSLAVANNATPSANPTLTTATPRATILPTPTATALALATATPTTVSTPTPAAQPATESTGNIGGSSYTVVRGDNLWDIAVRAYGDGYKWTQIAKENNLQNPGVIHAGNVLSIPR